MDSDFQAELDEAIADSHQSHNVTKRDQLWLIVLAVAPFATATVWFVETR